MIFNRDVATSPSTKQNRSSVFDAEFGSVHYKRNPTAKTVRLRVADDGTLNATLPTRAPLYLLTRMIEASRHDIRKIIEQHKLKLPGYADGMNIGKSHQLRILYRTEGEPRGAINNQFITIVLPKGSDPSGANERQFIGLYVKKALFKEAKAYLPRRLSYLAEQLGYTYQKERFGHQRGRWGSCSTSGTISLNVALMNLPWELIDYVLIHELAHTKQMNHSPAFWSLVESAIPDYKICRKKLKMLSPIC